MMRLHSIARLRIAVEAMFLFGLAVASAPAQAAMFTTFWDQSAALEAAYGGISQATASNAHSSAGIPIITVPGLDGLDPTALAVNHTLVNSTLVLPTPVGSAPATITSNWSATNTAPGLNNGTGPLQNLYLAFQQPITSQITVNAQPQSVTYAPSDVGLTLTPANWVIFQVDVGSSIPVDPSSKCPVTVASNDNCVYYPAVSLGTLPYGAAAGFSLLYTLKNPQEQLFTEPFNYQLGMPEWTLLSTSAVVPEPTPGLLLLVGLLVVAGGRRYRS